LECGNSKLCQSMAIAKFIACQCKMEPTDPLMKSKVTEMMMCCEDVFQKFTPTCYETDTTVKCNERVKLCKTTLPMMLNCMDKMIGDNKCPGYCVGESNTTADFYVFSMVDMFKSGQFEHVPSTCTEEYKNMMAVYNRVMAMPGVSGCKATEDNVAAKF